LPRMNRIQIHIDADLDAAAEEEAQRRGLSKAAFIRECVAARLGRIPDPDGDPWEQMIGWIDQEPLVEGTIDEIVYGLRET
jgi:hypothetical protein